MAKTVLYMAMSLDGFITGPDDDEANPAGTGGIRLIEWLAGGGSELEDYRPGDRQSQMPVLLGKGRLLFDHLGPEHIEHELVQTLEAPKVLHLRSEVRR